MTISKQDITNAFQQCGVKKGDVMMLHADAIVLAQIPDMTSQERFQLLFDALFEVLGEEGTLVMPAFTYSFTKGEDFDPAGTPSTVGALTEYFRHLPGVLRSRHPIFSIAARGKLAETYANTPIDDCFGAGCPFDLLVQHDAWIGCIACGFDRITFVHYVEQQAKVDYRFFKTFSGNLVDSQGSHKASVRYLVRNLERETDTDLTRLKAHMERKKLLATLPVGRVGLTVVRARHFLQEAQVLLAEDPVALICEGRK